MNTLRFIILAAVCGILMSCKGLAADVRITWDPPAPDEVGSIEGYRVYSITLAPPIKPPAPAAEANIPSPPPEGTVATYQLLTPDPIPATRQEFILEDYTPGTQLIVRAFNFMGEGPDSDILTLHAKPKKVDGLKAVALIIEASQDLKAWAPFAIVYTVADLAAQFFRLDAK